MAFTVTWRDDGVVVNLSGDLTIDEIDKAGETLYEDERFRRCKYQIFDFLNSDVSSVALEEVGDVAAKDVLASITLNNPDTALVTNNHVHQALLEHYVSLTRQLGVKWGVQFFATREEAEEWCKDNNENT